MSLSSAQTLARSQKSLYAQQLQRVQLKQEDDLHLLQGYADYAKRRAEIERDYADKLDKLAKSCQKLTSVKSGYAGSASPASTTNATRPTLMALQAVVSEAEDRSKIGFAVVEKIQESIIEAAKQSIRTQQSFGKKQMDCWQKCQEALLVEIAEMENAKREYEEAEKAFEATSRKHTDLLSGKTGLLSSMKNVLSSQSEENRLEKVKLKLKSSIRRLQDTRNEYVLALESSNIYQTRYWHHDLPAILLQLDGDYHTTFSALVHEMSEQDMRVSEILAINSKRVQMLSGQISRDVESKIFMAANEKLFPGPKLLQFDACGEDQINQITVDEVSKVLLSNQLLQLTNRRDELAKVIDRTEKEIAGLEQMAKVYNDNPGFGNAANPMETRVELNQQITTLSNSLLKIEKKIALIKAAGVDIPKQPTALLASSRAVDNNATLSQPEQRARNTNVQNAQSNMTIPAPLPGYKSTSEPLSTRSATRPAKVLYDFKGNDHSELQTNEGDVLDVISGDEDGWIKASLNGRIGLVPANYIEMMAESIAPVSNSVPNTGSLAIATLSQYLAPKSLGTVNALFDYMAQEPNELNFSAGDGINVTDKCDDDEDLSEWWQGQNTRTGQTGVFPYIFTQGWESVIDGQPMSGQLSQSEKPPVDSSTLKSRRGTLVLKRGELTIKSGDMIAVTNTELSSSDWWEGTNLTTGEVGQFPKDYTVLV